jgi:hypothetical protein
MPEFNLDMVQALFWVIAGVVSFYFSIGNARVWTSIAVGFFLVLIGEVIPQTLPFLPGAGIPRVDAMAHIIGTIAIMVMTHGFQEYYVFSKTFELEGRKSSVYLGTFAVIVASMVFLMINPEPEYDSLRYIQLVSHTNWVFLSLINIDMIRKIYGNVKDTPIAKGFVGFMVVFVFIFLWKGSLLYIQVYDLDFLNKLYPFRYNFSLLVSNVSNFLASITVGITFLFLAKRLR